MSDDVELHDRVRLGQLLAIDEDDDLEITDAEPYPGSSEPAWSLGFRDRDAGVRLSVWWVADPTERNDVAWDLQQRGAAIGQNGALLLAGRCDEDGEEARDRLSELVARFHGEE